MKEINLFLLRQANIIKMYDLNSGNSNLLIISFLELQKKVYNNYVKNRNPFKEESFRELPRPFVLDGAPLTLL